MSDAALPPAEGAPDSKGQDTERVILISYPKIVFLWPSFLMALIAGVFMLFAGPGPSSADAEAAQVAADEAEEADDVGQAGMSGQAVVGWLFLVVLTVNLVVLSFDFPRATSLIIFFVIVAIVLFVWLMAVKFPTTLPALGGMVTAIAPIANATFYFFFALVLGFIYLGVWINTRFDYWEVRPNELLHHHGVLSDLERFSAPHLRIDKEINDIFEYVLLGSGRLILHPSNERRSIVLDNVFWISQKEKAITKMLGALQVQVRTDGG